MYVFTLSRKLPYSLYKNTKTTQTAQQGNFIVHANMESAVHEYAVITKTTTKGERTKNTHTHTLAAIPKLKHTLVP